MIRWLFLKYGKWLLKRAVKKYKINEYFKVESDITEDETPWIILLKGPCKGIRYKYRGVKFTNTGIQYTIETGHEDLPIPRILIKESKPILAVIIEDAWKNKNYLTDKDFENEDVHSDN